MVVGMKSESGFGMEIESVIGMKHELAVGMEREFPGSDCSGDRTATPRP